MNLTHCGFAILIATSHLALTSCDSKNEGSGNESAGGGSGGKPKSGGNEYVLAQKDYLYPAGTTVDVSQSMTTKDAAMTLIAGGQELKGTMSSLAEEQVFATMVSATEAKAEIKRDRQQNTIAMPGVPPEQPPEIRSTEGQTITFQLKDGDWVAGLLSGEELNEEQEEKADNIKKELLTREANVEMYGTEARKIGDEWEVDAASMPSFGDGDGDVGGTVSLKFAGVEDHAGFKCAVLTGTMDVTITPKPDSDEKMNIKMSGDLKIYRAIKYFTDLEVTVTGTMEVEGAPEEGISVKASGPMKMELKLKLTTP